MTAAATRHRLEVAERQLGLVQSFFPRIDAKVSALFAIAAAQIAVAALNAVPGDLKLWYVALPLGFFVLAIFGTIFNLYRCAYPHLHGGNASLTYFSEIAKLRDVQFTQQYCGISDEDLLKDICGQIWRNSEIVTRKYGYLRLATVFNMWSLLPWSAFLFAASLTHARAPIVG